MATHEELEAQYRLESKLTTIEAIIHDVQRALTRAAVKGGVTIEVRRDIALKLSDAANYAQQIPLRGNTNGPTSTRS